MRRSITLILLTLICSTWNIQAQTRNFKSYTASQDTVVVYSFETKIDANYVYRFAVNLDARTQYARFYIPFIGALEASLTYSMIPDTSILVGPGTDSAYTYIGYGAAAEVGGTISFAETLQDSERYWYGGVRNRAVNLDARVFPAPYLAIDLSTSKGTTAGNKPQWVYVYAYIRFSND